MTKELEIFPEDDFWKLVLAVVCTMASITLLYVQREKVAETVWSIFN